MRILGISAFYHDSAAALIDDGRIVAAAQEERFTRKKHDAAFPHNAIAYCLAEAGVTADELDHVVFYDKPFLKFERLLETYIALAPRGFRSFKMSIPLWLREKLFQKSLLRDELGKFSGDFDTSRLLFCEHHLSHAASAFYPSPFEDAAVLTMDGVGEWATTSAAMGNGNRLEIFQEIHFPHSLGLLYSAVTYYTGFKVNSGEYKVMGLAPYGEPKYAKLILDNLIDLKPDGSFRLDMSYFDYCTGFTMTNDRFAKLFGEPVRSPDQLLTPFHMDVAASIQAVLDEAVLRLTRSLARQTGSRNLCLAGGVALNCVANGKVLRDGHFDNIWIQPAAGDAGGAVGAALAAYHLFEGQPRKTNGADGMSGAYLGPHFPQAEIERRLTRGGGKVRRARRRRDARDDGAGPCRAKSRRLVPGPHGIRSALARRALDPGRSALAGNAEEPQSEGQISRELSPLRAGGAARGRLGVVRSCLRQPLHAGRRRCQGRQAARHERRRAGALFGIDKLNVARSEIPAVTHVDYSARIQTVHTDTNPLFHKLLSRFKALTGCPILVNTSFNVRGEPIVCTPEDAFRCFMGNELDVLVVGNCVLQKAEQDPALKSDYSLSLEAD